MTSKEFQTTTLQNFQRIDEIEGVIYGVSLMTTGVAKGHGMYVDQKTLEQIRDVGKAYQNGIRVNMGHRTQLDQTIGRVDNLRVEDGKTLGDLHLFKEDAPNPGEMPLWKKIIKMAKEIPDTFGFSMAFSGEDEKIGGKLFARCEEIYSADLVPTPAANPDGLFEARIIPESKIDVKELSAVLAKAINRFEFSSAFKRIVKKKFENPNIDEQPRDENGRWSESGGDLKGGKFTPDKENGGGRFEHEGHSYPVNEDGEFQDHKGQKYIIDDDGDAKKVSSENWKDALDKYSEALKDPENAGIKAYRETYEKILKEENGNNEAIFNRALEPTHAAALAIKEEVKKLSDEKLKTIVTTETGEKKLPKSRAKREEIAATVISRSISQSADMHIDYVKEKLGLKNKEEE